MSYSVRYESEALEDADEIPVYHLRRIKSAIEEQLTSTPFVRTRHRKPIAALTPPWEPGSLPFWQLTVEPYRIFYDEDEGVVVVRMIRLKPPTKTTEEIIK